MAARLSRVKLAGTPTTLQSPLYEHVRAYVSKHAQTGATIHIIVPYIRTDVIRELLDGIDSKVVIITTWHPKDLLSGSSELSLYDYCNKRSKDNGPKTALYVNDKIHLKVVSADLRHYVLCTGNMSQRGMHPGGNYEMGIIVKEASPADRLYFEHMRAESRLVTDAMCAKLADWLASKSRPPDTTESLESLVGSKDSGHDHFLVSALPMTRSVGDLVSGYLKMEGGHAPSDDAEIAACIYHDLANYSIRSGLDADGLRTALQSAFFGHPFVQKIDSLIDPEAYFGKVKEWVQVHCTDVPVPSRRDLTGNVQVLYEWFENLGDGKYAIDVPKRHSQRIYKVGI